MDARIIPEEPPSPKHATIRRADYRPPDWLVPEIQLDFVLAEAATRGRAPAAAARTRPGAAGARAAAGRARARGGRGRGAGGPAAPPRPAGARGAARRRLG